MQLRKTDPLSVRIARYTRMAEREERLAAAREFEACAALAQEFADACQELAAELRRNP